MNEVRLDTYNKCVNSFKQADKVMGSAFHQKLNAIGAAREFYIDEHGKEHGFVSQFASDCGVKQPYMSKVNAISKSEVFLQECFSELGSDTLYALANAPAEVHDLTRKALDNGERVTKKDVDRWANKREEEEQELDDLFNQEQEEEPKASRKEPDYSVNPMNMRKLTVGVVSTLRLLSSEQYSRDLSDKQLAEAILHDIQSTGGSKEDPIWERHCLDNITRSVERLNAAVKLLPQVKPNLKRVK